MSAYEELKQHEGKSVEKVEQIGGHIRIKFYDESDIILIDNRCSVCGGYTIQESTEHKSE